MNGKLLMAAIGEVQDRYVMEFAQVEPVKKAQPLGIAKLLPLAACLCLILAGALTLIRPQELPKPQPGTSVPGTAAPSTVPSGNVIWAPGDLHSYEEPGDMALTEPGTIQVDKALTEAFERYSAEHNIFAIEVHELSGADRAAVYEQFVSKLGVAEDYLEHGLLFATRKQVEAFRCPQNMSIVLAWAVPMGENIALNRNNIQNVRSETLAVTVYLDDDVDNVMRALAKYEATMPPDEYLELWRSSIEEAVEKAIHGVLEDHGISEDTLINKGIYLTNFTAELSKETVERLIGDPRVESITMYEVGDLIQQFGDESAP